MTLLAETIQEYLKDYHPNWHVNECEELIYIDSTIIKNMYIALRTIDKTILAYTSVRLYPVHSTTYTDHTLLQQITTAIKLIA